MLRSRLPYVLFAVAAVLKTSIILAWTYGSREYWLLIAFFDLDPLGTWFGELSMTVFFPVMLMPTPAAQSVATIVSIVVFGLQAFAIGLLIQWIRTRTARR